MASSTSRPDRPAISVRSAPRRPDVRGLPWGRLLLSTAALVPAVGAVLADWNATHVFNPEWPAHAKFHNAQTITLAALMSALSLWQLWGPGEVDRSRLRWATLLGAVFWLTAAPAVFFPGSAFVDPDSPVQPFSLAGIPVNQVTAQAAILLPLLAGGYVLAVRRLGRAGVAGRPS